MSPSNKAAVSWVRKDHARIEQRLAQIAQDEKGCPFGGEVIARVRALEVEIEKAKRHFTDTPNESADFSKLSTAMDEFFASLDRHDRDGHKNHLIHVRATAALDAAEYSSLHDRYTSIPKEHFNQKHLDKLTGARSGLVEAAHKVMAAVESNPSSYSREVESAFNGSEYVYNSVSRSIIKAIEAAEADKSAV